MAQRGRKPKPTAIKLLEGNPGKRSLNTGEPQPNKKAPRCPSWLEDEAKKEWKRMAKQLEHLGILTEIDMAAFAGYCQACRQQQYMLVFAFWQRLLHSYPFMYTIPKGYHNGNGKVTANSLASQTSASARASDILSEKNAWVNGSLVNGNIPVKLGGTAPLMVKSDTSGERYFYITIPKGYYGDAATNPTYGDGQNPTVLIRSSKSIFGEVTADQVLKGKTFTSGNANLRSTGTMEVINATLAWSWGNQMVIPQYIRTTGYSYVQHAHEQQWNNVYNVTSTMPLLVSQGFGYIDVEAPAVGYYHIMRYMQGFKLSAGKYRVCFRIIHYNGSGASGSNAARFYMGLSNYTGSFGGGEGASAMNVARMGPYNNMGNSSYSNYYTDFELSSEQTIYAMLALVHRQKISCCAISIWKLS